MKTYTVIIIILCILICGIAIAEVTIIENDDSQHVNSYVENKQNNSFQKLDNQIKKTWY